jgi:tetratricopeptide (TPR) repeat protein
MFNRFQFPKDPAPFPIEENIKCPQCGFNHVGWAFEPGYAKLCVKCGSVLETSEIPEQLEDQPDQGAGFFGRIFQGMFNRKQRGQEQTENGKGPAKNRAQIQRYEDPPGEREAFHDITGENPRQPGQERPDEGPSYEANEAPEYPLPHDKPPDPEAARVGACKREGRLLAAQGRYEEAAEMFQKVVAFEPNDVESWAELGRIHYQGTKDLTKSIECSRKALEVDGDLVRVKCNLCLALLFDNQFDLARKGFLEVIRSVRNSRGYDEEFQENCRALLQDCLGDLYLAKKTASGEMLAHISEFIELLELEKIYFH